MNNQIFTYNGNKITFQLGNGDVMVNLTNISKSFPNKNLAQIVNSQEIAEYTTELAKLQNYSLEKLIVKKRGGANSGTWAHQKVALRVAQKLSPKFAIWVDTKIEELLKTGQVQLTQDPLPLLKLAVSELEKKDKQIKLLQPKADFADRVIDSEQRIDIGQASKILELPFGRNTMFKKLREIGIFFKNKNEPKQEYIKRGYFILKEQFIERNNHDGFVILKVLVTQKGLEYLHKVFNSSNTKNQELASIV